MNQLQVFQNSEFGELQVMTIDGKEYFPATQCARILGYTNARDAIKRHCKVDGVVKHDGGYQTRNQHGVVTNQRIETKYINEGNLYRLILRSKLPSAEKYTYQNVTDFLSEQGIKISKSSIGRYAQRFRDEV